MSAGKRHGKSTIVLKGYGDMKVYVVTEYGGSYDDSWNHIMGIFTDKDKAEEVKNTYWTKVQNRLEGIKSSLNILNESDEELSYDLQMEQYNLQDIGGVKLDEYPLDEFLGGYYYG